MPLASLVVLVACAESHGADGVDDAASIACGEVACAAGREYCVHCPEGPICTDADPSMQSDLWTPHSECAGVGLAPFHERPDGPVRFCDDASDCAPGAACGVLLDSRWASCTSIEPDRFERVCRDERDCLEGEACVVVDSIGRCRVGDE